jgi:selenocysteine-specific elongation factor
LILRALEQQILRIDALTAIAGPESGSVVAELVERGLLLQITDDLLTSPRHWESLKTRAIETVSRFHDEQPRRRGIPRDELRNRLSPGESAAFDRLVSDLVAEGRLVDAQRTLRLPSFEIELDPPERASADRWLAAIRDAPFNPPPPDAFGISPATLLVLLERDELVPITEQIALTPEALRTVESEVLRVIDSEGRITLARYRDSFETSRKYAQAMLEYFDRRRITRRVGDDRVRFRPSTGEDSREGDR